MKWSEFAAFMTGFNHDSPLGRIIAIRAENDPEVLRHFTPGQKRIRNEWRSRRAKEMPREEVKAFIDSLKNTFISMAKAGEVNAG